MERKAFIWTCQRKNSEFTHEKTWILLRKGNLKKETEYLLIVAKTTP